MMVGLIAGAYLGLKYLYWEMMHLPSSPPKGGGAKLVYALLAEWNEETDKFTVEM